MSVGLGSGKGKRGPASDGDPQDAPIWRMLHASMDGMPELHLVTTIYRATNAIVRELDRRLLRDYDVTFVQALTLLAIQSFDQPQPRLVAEFLSQQSQTVTGVLDRLERAGHIRRSRDLADRRGVRLELTGTGSRLAAALRERLSDYMEELFRGVPQRARQQLRELLDELNKSVKAAASAAASEELGASQSA